MAASWLQSALTPLAERLVTALEDSPQPPIAPPPPPVRDLEADLLAGATQRQQRIKTNGSANSGGGSSSSDLLHADVEKLLQQREQLRARLIAEQERRERAEAELVARRAGV